jgi:hypothetical protein
VTLLQAVERNRAITDAIRRLVDEHGAPNRFATSEIATAARISSGRVRRYGHDGPRDMMYEGRRLSIRYGGGWWHVGVYAEDPDFTQGDTTP